MAEKKAELTIAGKSPIELPIYEGSAGPDVVDVRGLVGKGIFTYDPGFVSTASCDSEITYIDGDAGVLLHRGYPIEQLAEKSNFLETCFLLLNGELPTAVEKAAFKKGILYHTMVDDQIHRFFEGFPRNAHPMAMYAVLLALYPPFTTTDSILMIPNIAWQQLFVLLRRCLHWEQCVTNMVLDSRLCTHRIAWDSRKTFYI